MHEVCDLTLTVDKGSVLHPDLVIGKTTDDFIKFST